MIKLRRAGFLALVASVGALAFASVGAAAPPSASATPVAIPINVSTLTGTFAGAFNVTQFAVQNGQLVAVGTLTGTVTNLLTGITQTISQALTLPVLQASGSCQILHLELGPVDLNLLGLMVHLDKVVLDVSAQAGPGNLLGNLLCGVANALNSNAVNNAVANLLNTVLGLL
jgi:hypothetical protein